MKYQITYYPPPKRMYFVKRPRPTMEINLQDIGQIIREGHDAEIKTKGEDVTHKSLLRIIHKNELSYQCISQSDISFLNEIIRGPGIIESARKAQERKK